MKSIKDFNISPDQTQRLEKLQITRINLMDRMIKNLFLSFLTNLFFLLFFILLILLSSVSASISYPEIKNKTIQVAKVFKVHLSWNDLQNEQKENKNGNDYFVDQGIRSGLIPGYLVNVYRKFHFFQKDKKMDLMFQDLWIPVGEAKVIYSGEHISIIRTHKIYHHANAPSLFYRSIMLNDLLDLSSLRPFVTEKKISRNLSSNLEKKIKKDPTFLLHENRYKEKKNEVLNESSSFINKNLDALYTQKAPKLENTSRSPQSKKDQINQSVRLLPDSLLGSFDSSFYE